MNLEELNKKLGTLLKVCLKFGCLSFLIMYALVVIMYLFAK